jgi:hypothetical protein
MYTKPFVSPLPPSSTISESMKLSYVSSVTIRFPSIGRLKGVSSASFYNLLLKQGKTELDLVSP